MEPGVAFVEEVELYRITYPTGDSQNRNDLHFLSKEAATVSSVLLGAEQEPEEVSAFKLSDGTYIEQPRALRMGDEPTPEEIADVRRQISEQASPATKLFLQR
jgi:hypothetical protein